MLILKSKLFIFFLLPFVSAAQGYLFNKDTLALFYKGYTNSFEINNFNVENTGTPLCFDGSIKIIPDQNSHENAKYYIEVLDTVTRNRGKLNISKYLTHPDGFIEKVFIDKFEFKIIPFPETILFVGSSSPGEKIDPKNMDLKVGIKETIPETTFRIEEYTIIANKETITIKSHETTQQAIGFIMKQAKGKEIKINAIYVDSIKKQRKVSGVFYL